MPSLKQIIINVQTEKNNGEFTKKMLVPHMNQNRIKYESQIIRKRMTKEYFMKSKYTGKKIQRFSFYT